MVTLEGFPGPFGPVKRAGLKFLQVKIEGFGHGASAMSQHIPSPK
jgi:hypothetical protein